MAKSLRSKWRRKCRAVKRVRYGKVELDRLKKCLGIDETKNEVNMEEISEVATVVDVKEKKPVKTKKAAADEMETDQAKRVYNLRTMRDQNGSYPVWMHPRRAAKIAKKGKKKTKLSKRK